MKNLKKIREIRGLKQSEVAKAVMIDQGTLSRYERGERHPDSDVLAKLSRFYNVATDYLIGNIDVPVSPKAIEFVEEYKKKSTDSLLKEYDLHAGDFNLTKNQQREIIELLKTSSVEEVEKLLRVWKAMRD